MEHLAPLVPFAMLAITAGHIVYSRATTDARIAAQGREIDAVLKKLTELEAKDDALLEKYHELALTIAKGNK